MLNKCFENRIKYILVPKQKKQKSLRMLLKQIPTYNINEYYLTAALKE